jgi:hypothetical protein
MTFDDFRSSLTSSTAPEVGPLLQALWYDARGNWTEAHHIAQDIDTADAAWVHAYLHRKEGDIGNARYWYRRAGRPESTDTFEAEWTSIVEALL